MAGEASGADGGGDPPQDGHDTRPMSVASLVAQYSSGCTNGLIIFGCSIFRIPLNMCKLFWSASVMAVIAKRACYEIPSHWLAHLFDVQIAPDSFAKYVTDILFRRK